MISFKEFRALYAVFCIILLIIAISPAAFSLLSLPEDERLLARVICTRLYRSRVLSRFQVIIAAVPSGESARSPVTNGA